VGNSAETVCGIGSDGAGRPLPLPWSHYVRLLSLPTAEARRFYEAEALRGGWTLRQLERQIDTQFYERTLLSKNKAAMLNKGAGKKPEDEATPEEELKEPLVLELLGLKDEYSESELEAALIAKLETFLKALVIIDLKLGKFTHADAGQMHLYLNYAPAHWTLPDENPPVGLILRANKREAVAHYALGGLPN
jgi:predicted nuclease of restriction endonuclease-like (RecB) superfamily